MAKDRPEKPAEKDALGHVSRKASPDLSFAVATPEDALIAKEEALAAGESEDEASEYAEIAAWTKTPRSGRGVKIRKPRAARVCLPKGFKRIDGGWLMPSPIVPGSRGEAVARLVFAERVRLGEASPPEVLAIFVSIVGARASERAWTVAEMLHEIERAASQAAHRELMAAMNPPGAPVHIGEWWAPVLEWHLAFAACLPDRLKPMPSQIVESIREQFAGAEWPDVSPHRGPRVPDGLAAKLRALVGDRLERLTPTARGGGPTKRRSPRAVVASLRRLFGKRTGASSQAEIARQVIELLGERPGLSAEQTRKALRVHDGFVRRALATLEREAVVENRGTDKKPAYHLR